MDTTIDTTATDLVVLDDVTAPDDSDNEGSTSAALIGSACFAAGIAVGTYVVPPVVGFVKSWFTKTTTTDVAEKIEEIMTAPETPKETKSA